MKDSDKRRVIWKGKERRSICIAPFILHTHSRKALRHGSHSVTCKLHHACLSFISRSPDGAAPNWGSRQSNCSLLPVYRPRRDERLGWPGWLVTRQLQVELRTGRSTVTAWYCTDGWVVVDRARRLLVMYTSHVAISSPADVHGCFQFSSLLWRCWLIATGVGGGGSTLKVGGQNPLPHPLSTPFLPFPFPPPSLFFTPPFPFPFSFPISLEVNP